MKKIILFTASLLMATFINSQIWVPATPFPDATGIVPTGGAPYNHATMINSLCEYNNELYVGGSFSAIGGIVAHNIARWNGTSWNTLGLGNFLQQDISDIIVYNGNLYFTADKLYKWDGTTIQEFTYFDTWSQDPQPVYGADLHVFNNELYIAPSNDGAPSYGRFFKYNGSNFTEIPTIISGSSNTVGITCVDNYNNSLYVAGSEGLYKYVAGNWIDCNGITTTTPEIHDIETYNNELYVIGLFNSIGGLAVTNNTAKYNGSTWSNIVFPEGQYIFPTAFAGSSYGTNHLKTMNNELYLAHTFFLPPSISFKPSPLTKYNGNQWITIAQNPTFGGKSGGGGCSIIYNNELYCGGSFMLNNINITGSYYSGNFVKLQGTGNLEDKENLQIQIYPNPFNEIISIKGEKNLNQPFSIFDQMGREVFKGKLNGISTEVNLSSLSNGIYMLKIEGNYLPSQIVKD